MNDAQNKILIEALNAIHELNKQAFEKQLIKYYEEIKSYEE